MIKIQNYDKEKQKLVLVTDMGVGLANAIRRGVLEIPTMAVDEVEISQNDSALYDEILAHRIGLVPIKSDKITKETKFKLKEKGPKIVYSTDMSPSIGVDYKIPLVILDEGQEIQLVADAKLGTGIEHVKYSPGTIYYKHNVEDKFLDFVEIDRDGNVKYEEGELQEKKVPEDVINEIKKLKKVNELLLSVECWGQIDVKRIFLESISALDKGLNELSKAIK